MPPNYAPVHLRVLSDASGWTITWIRRARRDGDIWDLVEVPLSEASERYLVRVVRSNEVLREVTVMEPIWQLSLAEQAQLGAPETLVIEVAQISDRYGPGLFAHAVLA
ncbi:MAG: hypothetical protein AAF330_06530 [Pseudomonadota bacterium]